MDNSNKKIRLEEMIFRIAVAVITFTISSFLICLPDFISNVIVLLFAIDGIVLCLFNVLVLILKRISKKSNKGQTSAVFYLNLISIPFYIVYVFLCYLLFLAFGK